MEKSGINAPSELTTISTEAFCKPIIISKPSHNNECVSLIPMSLPPSAFADYRIRTELFLRRPERRNLAPAVTFTNGIHTVTKTVTAPAGAGGTLTSDEDLRR